MSSKRNHHSKQFKLDTINYRNEHPDLTQVECAKNLGIGVSTLAKWESQFCNNDSDIPVRGSGNYQSDDAKDTSTILHNKLYFFISSILRLSLLSRIIYDPPASTGTLIINPILLSVK